MTVAAAKEPAALAHAVRDGLPQDALFAERAWRISPTPFPLSKKLLKELDFLGRGCNEGKSSEGLMKCNVFIIGTAEPPVPIRVGTKNVVVDE